MNITKQIRFGAQHIVNICHLSVLCILKQRSKEHGCKY
nr:MAG TPA: hypothetical protein [Caudoviricetes sp.]